MVGNTFDLGEYFRQEEEKRLFHVRAEIKAEQDAFNALSDAEKAEVIRLMEARFELPSEANSGPSVDDENTDGQCPDCGADMDDKGCRFCDQGDEFPD